MGFRTNILPCIEVLRADGRICQGFLPKLMAEPTDSSNNKKTNQQGKARNQKMPRRPRVKSSLDILVK
jgi:hypothetical protein